MSNKETGVWKYVDRKDNISECWLWKGFKDPVGYGQFKVNYKHWLPHRLIYKLFYKTDIKNCIIQHLCNNSSCCNPFHLICGRQKENIEHKVKCNRQAKGERIFQSKLTEKQVRQIRETLKGGEKPVSVARRFGIHVRTVYHIKDRDIWKHVT